MSAATTLILAREDLSIPGAVEAPAPTSDRTAAAQAHFFDLVSRGKPDVIVLDLSRATAAGADTILTVRQLTDIPILVVCHPEPPMMDDYRIAGAADCISPPVDLIGLNETVQRIMRIDRRRHDSGIGALPARQP